MSDPCQDDAQIQALQARIQEQADLIAPTDEFCMSMDAHMKLTPYWDRRSVVQWLQTANEHAVLSHYPKGFEQYYEHVSGLSIPTNCIQVRGHEPVSLY